jgi:hypothetical protein
MSKRIEFTKTGPHWLSGQAWEGRVVPRPSDPEPGTSTPPKKTRLFGRKEKAMPTVKLVRVHVLRCVATSRGLFEPHQVLDVDEAVAAQLVAGGSARLAADEELNSTPRYDPQ